MELEKLYQLAEREGLNIYNCHISSINGCYIKYDIYKVIRFKLFQIKYTNKRKMHTC